MNEWKIRLGQSSLSLICLFFSRNNQVLCKSWTLFYFLTRQYNLKILNNFALIFYRTIILWIAKNFMENFSVSIVCTFVLPSWGFPSAYHRKLVWLSSPPLVHSTAADCDCFRWGDSRLLGGEITQTNYFVCTPMFFASTCTQTHAFTQYLRHSPQFFFDIKKNGEKIKGH